MFLLYANPHQSLNARGASDPTHPWGDPIVGPGQLLFQVNTGSCKENRPLLTYWSSRDNGSTYIFSFYHV